LTTNVGAQETPDLDRRQIEEAVRAAEEETAAFALEVAKRAEAYAEEARTLSSTVMDRMAREEELDLSGEGPLDWTGLLSGAPSIAQAQAAPQAPAGVMVLVSLSMPEDSLRAIVTDAHRAGVPVIIRGFVGGSLRETAVAMHRLLNESGTIPSGPEAQSLLGGIKVDPRAFRVFRAEAVPVFIASDAPLPDCDGLDCSAPPPPHARIAGNISLGAALEALAEEGVYGRSASQAALARLEAEQ
ncbi:MAG: type-F conjugative transfer system pilin assembly protein TrbC, partial [Pseudomonadota bacterium]